MSALLLLTLFVFVANLAMAGQISVGTAAFVFLASLFVIAVGRGVAQLTFRVLLPLTALAVLVIGASEGSLHGITAILLQLLPLGIVLSALFWMFRGVLGGRP